MLLITWSWSRINDVFHLDPILFFFLVSMLRGYRYMSMYAYVIAVANKAARHSMQEITWDWREMYERLHCIEMKIYCGVVSAINDNSDTRALSFSIHVYEIRIWNERLVFVALIQLPKNAEHELKSSSFHFTIDVAVVAIVVVSFVWLFSIACAFSNNFFFFSQQL